MLLVAVGDTASRGHFSMENAVSADRLCTVVVALLDNNHRSDDYCWPADYRYANGQMRTGMLVCQYQLTDVNEGDGGLGLIPGSMHRPQLPILFRQVLKSTRSDFCCC